MKCPACAIELKMSERSGIEIDYCSQCRGVWLDRGELDKIIERSDSTLSQGAYNCRPKEHRGQDKDDYHYKKKKRESILGELFDF